MKKFDPLPNELRKLGLDKKEADIYLSLLGMGPSSVQEIASVVKLSRPTVYRVLDTLGKKGLISKTKESKRSFFVASSPDKFLGILKIKRRRAEEQEREFLRIISVLQAKYHLLSDRNEIRAYQGRQSKEMVLDDLASSNTKNIYVFLISPDKTEAKKLESIYRKIKTRQGKIKIKEIYCEKVSPSKTSYIERKTIPEANKYASKNLIITNKAFLFGKNNSFVIEQEDVVQMMKILHRALWDQASLR